MINLDSLIVAAKDGDRTAQNELFTRYRSLLRLMAAQVVDIAVCHREDASDVVQLTEMEAYRSLSAFRGNTAGEFTAWMKQILLRNAANLLRDHRAGKRDVRREQHWDDAASALTWRYPAAVESSPSGRVIKAETALDLAAALNKLPDEQRIAVRMRHIEGKRVNDIALAMGKTPAAVAGLLRRGLAALKLQLEEDIEWL